MHAHLKQSVPLHPHCHQTVPSSLCVVSPAFIFATFSAFSTHSSKREHVNQPIILPLLTFQRFSLMAYEAQQDLTSSLIISTTGPSTFKSSWSSDKSRLPSDPHSLGSEFKYYFRRHAFPNTQLYYFTASCPF